MRRLSVSAGSECRKLRQQQLDSRWRCARKLTDVIVRLACALGLVVPLVGLALAADTGAVIALPDAPFVIPYVVPHAGLNNVTTQLNNNARQGANLGETTLNPGNVQNVTFGQLYMQKVKGQVLAQPLYVRDVDIGAPERRSLVVVATAANIVYALDANDLSIVFQKQLTSYPVLTPDNPMPVDPTLSSSLVSVCAETYPPYIGVTSTPVIDAATGTVFVVAYNPLIVRHELHALNLHDRFASDHPVPILPPASELKDFHSISPFPPGRSSPEDAWSMSHRNRPGLLLSKGIIYVAFGSFICDSPHPYAGWVLGYSENDLKLVADWETPNPGPSGSSGIWQSGRGLVASDDGDIYFMTGNDTNFSDLLEHTSDTWFSGGGGADHDCFKDSSLHCSKDSRLANSFVILRPSGPKGLEVVGSFSPKNSSQLSAGDTDLGSSGPILLPGDRLAGGGKQGRVYVIDPSTMQSLQDHTQPGDDGFQGFQAFRNFYHADSGQESCTSALDNGHPDNYCKQLPVPVPEKGLLNQTDCPDLTAGCYLAPSCYQHCQPYGPNIHAGFVYWQPDPDWGLIYAMPEKEHVEAFRYDISEKKIKESPDATSIDLIAPDGMPGGALSISANGRQDGIVWVSMPNQGNATAGAHRGSLVALDARDLRHLWDDQCIWYFAKFNPPTVADGRVFLATFADPKLARKPGENCDQKDSPDPNFTQQDLSQPVGVAWIIEYGLYLDFVNWRH
jgi:hypothetical protein